MYLLGHTLTYKLINKGSYLSIHIYEIDTHKMGFRNQHTSNEPYPIILLQVTHSLILLQVAQSLILLQMKHPPMLVKVTHPLTLIFTLT